jgi:hypothetical protein
MACVLWLALVQQLVTGQAGPVTPADEAGHWVTACYFWFDVPSPDNGETAGQGWWNDWVQQVIEQAQAARMERLLFESDGLRDLHKAWVKFWIFDQPSHMTYQRVHGGMGP